MMYAGPQMNAPTGRAQPRPGPGPSVPGARASRDKTRRSAVTGLVLPAHLMFRFVAGPDNCVYPDLAGSLPGRGVWIEAQAEAIGRAVTGNVFSKAFKKKVKVSPGLAEQLEALMAARVLDLLRLARRAGDAQSGFEKTRAYLAAAARGASGTGPVVALVAADASPGSAKKFFGILDRLPTAIHVHRATVLTADELGQAFGRARVAQAIVRPGGLAAKLVIETGRLAGIRGSGHGCELEGAGLNARSLDGGDD